VLGQLNVFHVYHAASTQAPYAYYTRYDKLLRKPHSIGQDDISPPTKLHRGCQNSDLGSSAQLYFMFCRHRGAEIFAFQVFAETTFEPDTKLLQA
jgi:hypothetical protein